MNSKKEPRKSGGRLAGVLLASQVAACSVTDLVGKDLTDEQLETVKVLLEHERVDRDIAKELATNAGISIPDIWGGTVSSNETALSGIDEEVGDKLAKMLEEGKIRAYDGSDFLGGEKSDSVAFFADTPISRNPDDGSILLNTDRMEEWSDAALAHEAAHSSFGGHSDTVKDCANDPEALTYELAECAVEDGDVPYEVFYLYQIARELVEADEDKLSERFIEMDWHENVSSVFDALEKAEGQSREEWAEEVAGLAYSTVSNELKVFEIDRDGLAKSLAASDVAWEEHQELLSEIRLEVEAEYLAELNAEQNQEIDTGHDIESHYENEQEADGYQHEMNNFRRR